MMKLKKKTSIKRSRIKTGVEISPIKRAKQYISRDEREKKKKKKCPLEINWTTITYTCHSTKKKYVVALLTTRRKSIFRHEKSPHMLESTSHALLYIYI